MKQTPFFPAWRPRLNPLGSGSAQAVRKVRPLTLCQLESSFAPWMSSELFPKAGGQQNSRDCIYTRWRTFWCMLWQAFNPQASGREVVRQLQALFALEQGPSISEEDGAYCRAKARLCASQFPKALALTGAAADRQACPPTLLQGRVVKAVDGSTVALPDTLQNRSLYPPARGNEQTPCFPMMRFVVLFSLLSGAILAAAPGSLGVSELSLLHSLAGQLAAGEILLGDRGFGSYPVIAWLHCILKVDFIGRTTRRVDGRHRVKRLARNDWLISWARSGTQSPWLSALERTALPQVMTMRAVRGSCYRKGFRVRRLTVITTLLDPERYPAREILQAYLRRWRLEMCIDDLKTTLHMEMLRGHTAQMVQKELYTHLISHNLIRCIMAQSALEHELPLERISFKGTLDALRHFTHAMARSTSRKKRRKLWDQLLATLAADQIPERLGRREPRAIKRKKAKYPRLNTARKQFIDHPKRNVRLSRARLRKQALM
jgi:hypothetical protein